MKCIIYITLILLMASCNNKTNIVSKNSPSYKPKTDSLLTDSVLSFSFKTNFSNSNISNKSDRQVDLLFNGVDYYFGGQKNSKVSFRTECLPCEPTQEYMGGLLFAKRLLITKDEIKFYKTDFNIPDSVNRIKVQTEGRKRTYSKFQFTDGKGSIKYIGVSCNDADFNKVRLSYPTGDIIIDSLINASFFEYDLNKDGQMEQYLYGSRNCSQEFVLLRIRKPNNTK